MHLRNIVSFHSVLIRHILICLFAFFVALSGHDDPIYIVHRWIHEYGLWIVFLLTSLFLWINGLLFRNICVMVFHSVLLALPALGGLCFALLYLYEGLVMGFPKIASLRVGSLEITVYHDYVWMGTDYCRVYQEKQILPGVYRSWLLASLRPCNHQSVELKRIDDQTISVKSVFSNDTSESHTLTIEDF